MSSGSLASWIILLPLAGFLFCAFSGFLFSSRKAQNRAVSLVAPGVVILSFLLSLFLLPHLSEAPGSRILTPLIPGTSLMQPWIKMGGFQADFTLLLDPLSLLMALIVTGVGGLIHIYAIGYMAEDEEQPRFFTYFNLFIFTMLLLVMGDNFLMMFVGWEGVGLCSYLLIGFWYRDAENAKAGNKAFIVNRIGDLGFSLGIMAAWSYFGTVSFFTPHGHGVMDLARHAGGAVDVMGHLVPGSAITMICLLLFAGAVGKSAQIPLFVWLPDAMAGPTPVSALIHAATMVTAGVVMLTRCSWLFVQSVSALHVIAWVGAITAILGATVGLVQTDIKKVLAFSTVSQLGYMFIACGVGAFSAGMFHVLTHAFFKGLLFLGAGAVIHSMLGEQDMRKMGGLKKLLPSVWGVMIIGTYTIAGIPLLSGFWSKDAILEAASRSFYGDGTILYLIGLGSAFITAFYMNRLMWKTFYTQPRFNDGELTRKIHSNSEEMIPASQGHGHVHPSPGSMMWPLYALAALSVIAGLLLGPTGIFEKFLLPSVAPLSLGNLHQGAEMFPPWAGYLFSSLAAFAGIGAAYYLYQQHIQTGELMPEERKLKNPVYIFLQAKWGFDALYNLVFLRGGEQIASFFRKVVEEDTIGGAENGVTGLVGGLSKLGRQLQTGYVRNYALVMFIGAVALIAGLLARLMH